MPSDIYAIGYLLVSIAESIMEFALMPDAIGNVSGSTELTPGKIGQMIGKLLRIVYPIILLIFMRKAEVKAALK